jgi:hypothetical protein
MPVPIVVSSSAGVAGATLRTIRARLAATLGYFALGTVTTQAASLEPERYLISDQLQSDQRAPDHVDGLYAWVRDGAEARSQRAVVDGTFDGPYGSLVVDRGYGAPLVVGTVFELSVLPALAWQGASGLNDIINLGLETLTVIDYASITVTAETDGRPTTEYDFSAYPWPVKAVEAVIYPRLSTTAEARCEMPKTWTFQNDAELPVLSFDSLPAKVGDVIEVRLRRPATTRIKTGGAWGDSTDGLVLDTDACLYDAATVVAAARPIALDRLALLQERGSKTWMSLKGEADQERTAAAAARFGASFRGNGYRKVGATGGR